MFSFLKASPPAKRLDDALVDAEYKNVKSKIEFFVEQKQKNKL